MTCEDCSVSFDNLTQPSRLLLHWHNKLDHMGFDAIRALASKGFLPKCIARANAVKCAACQAGKQIKKPASRKGKIIGDTVRKPGDLIHMDQAQSSTPGRPLTYSGKNSKQKIFYVTVFVDSISKKVFVEFHNSTGAKEAIAAKHNMERDAYKSGVKIKSFRADNGIFKSEEFRLELKNNAQDITYCGVGAHHQNGIAERYIRTMVEKARTVLQNGSAVSPGTTEGTSEGLERSMGAPSNELGAFACALSAFFEVCRRVSVSLVVSRVPPRAAKRFP